MPECAQQSPHAPVQQHFGLRQSQLGPAASMRTMVGTRTDRVSCRAATRRHNGVHLMFCSTYDYFSPMAHIKKRLRICNRRQDLVEPFPFLRARHAALDPCYVPCSSLPGGHDPLTERG
jgi:hypothetical protein